MRISPYSSPEDPMPSVTYLRAFFQLHLYIYVNIQHQLLRRIDKFEFRSSNAKVTFNGSWNLTSPHIEL